MKLCNLCSRPISATGLCRYHYLKAWREANPSKVKEWYKINSEKIKANYKAWYYSNPDEVRAKRKAWREANSAKVRAKRKAWREANSAKVKAIHKTWRDAHPHKIKAIKKRYMLRRKNQLKLATPKWVNTWSLLLIENLIPDGHEVDHIIPLLSKHVCGLHVPWNLQFLSKENNISKNNKLLPEFTFGIQPGQENLT